MNESHDGRVTMEQVLFLDLVASPQYEVPSDYAVTSNLPISKEAKQGDTGKQLPKGIGLDIARGSVVLEASANARKHEANSVLFRDVGCFEALHGGLGGLGIVYILSEENCSTLDSVPTK